MKTVYFSEHGPRSDSDRELYEKAVRMMHNIEAFAALAGPRAQPISGTVEEEGAATVVVAAQPCPWTGPAEELELTAHAVVKVDVNEGRVLACHAMQANFEVESFTFRLGNDGARLYDWTEADGSRTIHVYNSAEGEIPGFLVIVQD